MLFNSAQKFEDFQALNYDKEMSQKSPIYTLLDSNEFECNATKYEFTHHLLYKAPLNSSL